MRRHVTMLFRSVVASNHTNGSIIANRFNQVWSNYYHQYNLSRYSDIIQQPLFRWMSIQDIQGGTAVSFDDEDIYLTRMSCLHAEGQYMDDVDSASHHPDDENVFLTRMSHLHSYCYMKD